MASISLVVADFGWIMEEFAKRLAEKLPGATIVNSPDPKANIVYFLPYSAWQPGCSGITMALFTHIEQVEAARRRFFQVAKNVDYCITISSRYEKELQNYGIDSVKTITPGVNLELFSPKLKIGVVGRTYHTGRKGEALVKLLKNEPGIEWYFTGEGWPGPAQHLSPSQMPDFYRSMDYILVPSLIEGGPMCVLEALACGREVIAPDVGFVNEYPHIPFKLGDAEDIRRVLRELLEKKRQLSNSVSHRTWDAFVKQHVDIFKKIIRLDIENAKLQPVEQSSQVIATNENSKLIAYDTSKQLKVALVLQDSESMSRGGPSVRARRTAQTFQNLGISARIVKSVEINTFNPDITHVYNVWPPNQSLERIRSIFKHGSPIVFSPIFMELGELKKVVELITPALAYRIKGDVSKLLREITKLGKNRITTEEPLVEWHPGYFEQVRQMIKLADVVICLSDYEKKLLKRVGADISGAHIVHNGINTEVFAYADPNLFQNHFDISNFVLCVGRIEVRKNQLMLLKALSNQDIPIVFIGGVGNEDYAKLLKKYSNANIKFIGYLDPDSPMLASAFAACRVFTLPSFCEGAPLAALEACASGASLVLSNRSAEKEYFGERAVYCDPTDPGSIREAVLNTFATKRTGEDRENQKRFISENYNIKKHAVELLNVYKSIVVVRGAEKNIRKFRSDLPIYVDITSLVHAPNQLTGMLRVELMLTHELIHQYPHRLKLCYWDQYYRSITHEDFKKIFYRFKKQEQHTEFNKHNITNQFKINRVIKDLIKRILPPHLQIPVQNAWTVYKEAARITFRASTYPLRFILKKIFINIYKSKRTPIDSEMVSTQKGSEGHLIDSSQNCNFKKKASLFVPGSAWVSNNHYTRTLIKTIQKHNLYFSAIVFDVMPIDFPEFFPGMTVASFTFGFFNIIRHFDVLFTISNYSRERIRSASESKGFTLPPLKVIRLGEHLKVDGEGVLSPKSPIIKDVNREKFILFVSTLSPRKNHFMLYRIWKRLYEELGNDTPHLVFAGGIGWDSDDFVSLLKRDIHMTRKVHHTGTISDTDIDWLYKHCLFTVYPSLAEGWGLPISESLNYGKFCICSNTTAMTEIAPGLTERIDPFDVKKWYETILEYVTNEKLLKERERKIVERFRPNNWGECAIEIMNELNKYTIPVNR